MINIVAFSGGVDSTALVLWAFENLEKFRVVFCDTGWEHPITYAYVRVINSKLLQDRLLFLKSSKFPDGMRDLVAYKKRIPSSQAKFCTEELKVKPMQEYLMTLDEDYVVYQGIRGDESPQRMKDGPEAWSDFYDCQVKRPLFHWTKTKVFALLKKHNIAPNPMYKQGASRVGCFPCILVNHGDLRRMTLTNPDIWDRIDELEKANGGRSFFPPKFIPTRFHTGFDFKSMKSFPHWQDVKSYLFRKDIDAEQLRRWEEEKPAACMSIYNLCE